MKQSSIFKTQKSMSSRILCCASGGSFNILIPTKLGKTELQGSNPKRSYRDYDGINGEPTEFEWNIFPGFTTLQLCGKINDLLSDLGQTPETSQEEFDLCQCSMASPVTEKATKMNAWHMSESSKYLREDLVLDNGHSLDEVLKRSGILQRTVHKELGIISRMKCCWNSQESGHPTFRATTPLSRGILKSKGHGKLSTHFAADEYTIETIFRIIISVNQLSIYGAVAAVCEEFESHQDGSGEPEILMGQSIVLGEIKAEVPLQNENPLNHQILWQQYIERSESLSPESKVSRFCKEAGFMRIVEVGQYFVTKDTGDFRQVRSVACREYTLPRDDPSSQPKGWIQGNMIIGPVLEVTTSFKTSYMELKFESGLWVKTILNLGSEFLVERSNMWSIQIKTIQKFLQIHKKIKCHKQVSRLLQPDQRQKQNHNSENLLIQQLQYRCTKELSHQNKLSLRAISRRK